MFPTDGASFQDMLRLVAMCRDGKWMSLECLEMAMWICGCCIAQARAQGLRGSETVLPEDVDDPDVIATRFGSSMQEFSEEDMLELSSSVLTCHLS